MRRFIEQCSFLSAVARSPKTTGAVAPSSRYLAAMMVRSVNQDCDDPILELGPGTGAITNAIVAKSGGAERLTCVEYEERMATKLAARFPESTIIRGDAFDLEALPLLSGDRKFGCVISSLPLLNFDPSKREKLLDSAMNMLQPGGAFVQFSYGFSAPIDINHSMMQRAASPWILRNLPPARVWTYMRKNTQG